MSRSWSPSRHHPPLEYLSLICHEEVFLILLLGDVSVVFVRATVEAVEAVFGLQISCSLREIIGVVGCRFETSRMNVCHPLIIGARKNVYPCNLSVCEALLGQAIDSRLQLVRVIRRLSPRLLLRLVRFRLQLLDSLLRVLLIFCCLRFRMLHISG